MLILLMMMTFFDHKSLEKEKIDLVLMRGAVSVIMLVSLKQ